MKTKFAAALAASVVCIGMSGVAVAEDFKPKAAGDFNVRLRAIGVLPDESGNITTTAGAATGLHVSKISNEYVPEVDFSYFITDTIAVELIAATTRHAVKASDGTDMGKVSLLPPTLTLQYHPLPKERFSPYVGAGVNYTIFYNEKDGSAASVRNISYKNSFGVALQAGVDIAISGPWSMNLDVKKIWLDTEVTTAQLKATDTNINPLIVGLGVGYRF